ncbi:MAG: methyltransferase [Bacteroidales bacterium]|nr:methyltransferase [Bacteroidales bacterium]
MMDYFDFKHFRLYQDKSAFRIGTDGVLLGAWADVSSAGKILDIGTGTGLIALMMAQRTSSEIVAIEPDGQSYEQAVENVDLSPWRNRIEVINTRIQDYLSEASFDLIVTNPPFFRQSLANRDERLAKARHDYDLSGTDLLSAVKRFMAPGGKFCLIFPFKEAAVFIAEAAGFGLYCNKIVKVKPLPAAPVKRMLMEFEAEKKELQQSFLTIEKIRHRYTDEYKKLTAEFYLAF